MSGGIWLASWAIACLWSFVTNHAAIISTVVSALAAVGIACYRVKLTKATTEQARLTRAALVRGQRAWLSVEVRLPAPAKLTFDRSGRVGFDMKNIGNAPATNISWQGWLGVLVPGTNLSQQQAQRSNAIRNQPFGIGPTLFLGQEFPPTTDWPFGAGASWAEIDAALPPAQR